MGPQRNNHHRLLKRGHSLEVILEEETDLFQQQRRLRAAHSVLELTKEKESWQERRLSERFILYRKGDPAATCCPPTGPCYCNSKMIPEALARQIQEHPLKLDSTAVVPTPAKRRNSTYLALACANAVSQGQMTRKFRQMFENPPVKEPPTLLSRAQVQQAIQESRMRRNSIASVIGSSIPAPIMETDPTFPTSPPPPKPVQPVHQPQHYGSMISLTSSKVAPPKPAKPIHQQYSPTNGYAPSTPPKSWTMPKRPASVAGEIRCDKCSSILPSPPVSPSPPTPPPTIAVKEELPSKPIVVPVNREVVEDELPKPDTVRNARSLFESSLVQDGYNTLQHVKSNPSSKIFRSESVMTLDRASNVSRPISNFRWPSSARSEHGGHHLRNRSPSPSQFSEITSPSPMPTTPFSNKTGGKNHGVAQQAFYYRSTPSLYQNRPAPAPVQSTLRVAQHQRLSRHSTDVESYVSESECWSDHDLESETGSYNSSQSSDPELLEGTRYISPDVMEKIRSYGMTLTFVNGKMVDEDAEEDDDDDEPIEQTRTKATQKVVQSIRSAGQSRPTAVVPSAPVAKKTSTPINNQENKSNGLKVTPKKQESPARIVACLAKSPAENIQDTRKQLKKQRHSSGESSASSGISSASNNSSNHYADPSPFASLKRTKASTAVAAQHQAEAERCPSPVLRSKTTKKSTGSSPFGSHSVVYQFSSTNPASIITNRTPMYV